MHLFVTFLFFSAMYNVDESVDPPTLVYLSAASRLDQVEIVPVDNPERSKYGNNPDIESFQGADRGKLLGAMRTRRFTRKKKIQFQE